MANTSNPVGRVRTAQGKGHGTEALGPSDSSDSGGDIRGGPGGGETDPRQRRRLERESEDRLPRNIEDTAGADIGDFELDSDSDRGGTGERIGSGRDSNRDVPTDIAPDRVADETIADATEERQRKKNRGE